ncbi:RNA polymerase subunit sigma [Clostridium sp. MB40-C1]|uniref:RNA polymerase subunit sigma n=1 Tax=Clostridium sp. MB40-C1 TaxID=3070996 RepID=UPI0027E03CCF|nr:RNA polymerase subunit sigma [Clostridium sp. MB40-C1]WMJ81974.1 RNA polymerase subunit sigma [Clostridium sp. MB40-C1]
MLDKIRKQEIGDKEYSFRMTNKTIRKIDEKYGNYGSVIYGLMEGQQFYTNSLKLVSMSCIDKDKEGNVKEFSIEELEEIMTAEQYRDITTLAVNLYFDYIGLDTDEPEKKEETEKN